MSKAFTSEETPDDEIVVPPRAPLPAGSPNWVTPRGLARLREESAALDAERSRTRDAEISDADRARRLAVLAARTAALHERISGAQLVMPPAEAPGTVRFGATVTVRTLEGAREGEERAYGIVGVDEADPDRGLVAFTSPLARALLGRAVGDEVTLRLPRGEESLEVVAIGYAKDDPS